jgi:hypothetical protein
VFDPQSYTVRRDPFPGRMGQHGGQVHNACGLIDRRGLDRRDLMLAQGLAHDLEAACARGVAEQPLRGIAVLGLDRPYQRLFWIGELDLRLGERCGQGNCAAFLGQLANDSPRPTSRSPHKFDDRKRFRGASGVVRSVCLDSSALTARDHLGVLARRPSLREAHLGMRREEPGGDQPALYGAIQK